MLFFRSEEAIAAWCRERSLPVGPTSTLEQIWRLSLGWYSNRLEPDARRPQPDEVRAIFAAAGLDRPEWDPLGDSF